MKLGYNEILGRHMRFCQDCGIAMGLFTRRTYFDRFVRNRGLCPYCGKPAVKEDKEEVWLSISEAEAKYGIHHDKLSTLMHDGKVRWRPGHGGRGHTGRQIPEKEILRVLGRQR